MAQLDSKVASVLDKSHNEDDEDALLDSLENDPSLDGFREQRLQQLHSEFTRAKQMRSQEHGTYVEIKDEKALMDITTSTKLCVVHFFKPDFNRCRIMDEHLQVGLPAIGSLIEGWFVDGRLIVRRWHQSILIPASFVPTSKTARFLLRSSKFKFYHVF